MNATCKTKKTEARLEQQLTRLRNRLADAWAFHCTSRVIRRLEAMIQKRWVMLERTRNFCPQPVPA